MPKGQKRRKKPLIKKPKNSHRIFRRKFGRNNIYYHHIEFFRTRRNRYRRHWLSFKPCLNEIGKRIVRKVWSLICEIPLYNNMRKKRPIKEFTIKILKNSGLNTKNKVKKKVILYKMKRQKNLKRKVKKNKKVLFKHFLKIQKYKYPKILSKFLRPVKRKKRQIKKNSRIKFYVIDKWANRSLLFVRNRLKKKCQKSIKKVYKNTRYIQYRKYLYAKKYRQRQIKHFIRKKKQITRFRRSKMSKQAIWDSWDKKLTLIESINLQGILPSIRVKKTPKLLRTRKERRKKVRRLIKRFRKTFFRYYTRRKRKRRFKYPRMKFQKRLIRYIKKVLKNKYREIIKRKHKFTTVFSMPAADERTRRYLSLFSILKSRKYLLNANTFAFGKKSFNYAIRNHYKINKKHDII